jgi:NADH:ubiquinone oxidoreductase subunit 3 (subunit A)
LIQLETIVSLASIFFLTFVVGLLLYLTGECIKTRGERSTDKLMPYACGEKLPARRLQINVENFLVYAIYFLVFDILAFVLATSFTTPGYFPALYSLIVLMAIVLLLPLLRRR